MRIPGLAVAVATVALASVPSVASPDPQGGTLSEAIEAYIATLPPEPAPAALLEPAPALLTGWELRVTGSFYAPDANVEAEIGGSSGHIDGDLGEQMFPSLRGELLGDRWGVLFEVEARLLDIDDGGSDYELNTLHNDLGLIFRVLGGAVAVGTELDLFGGARFVDTEQDAGSVDDEDSWIEPFLGAQLRQPIPVLPDLFVRLVGSGFDMGPTKLHWSLAAAAEFSIGPVFFQVGWKYDDMHFSSSTGGGYGVDIQSSGPYLAVGVDF